MLLDVNTRKMLPPGDVAALIPDNSDLTAPMGLPAMVTPLDGEMQISARLPRYTDLDVNQHVNNTRYADWACDALGIQTMQEHCLQSLFVNYSAEVLPHQEMALHTCRRGDAFQVSGYHDGKLHFELGGKLQKR